MDAEIDPNTGPLIRQAFEKMARRAGTSAEIRQWLEAQGISLARSYFHSLFFNKLYIGLITIGGEETRAAPPLLPLVSEATFYGAQEAIRPRQLPMSYQHDREDFPLRGTLRCQRCGKYLTAYWASGRAKKYAYYRCLVCPGMNLPKHLVERAFYLHLVKVGEEMSFLKRDREKLLAQKELQSLHARDARRKLETEAERVAKLQGALAMKAAEGTLPDEIVRIQISELEQKRRKLAAELEACPMPTEDFEQALQFAEQFVSALPRHWESGNLAIKKQIQRFFYEHGAPIDKRGTIRTTKESHLAGSSALSSAQLSSLVAQYRRKYEPIKDC